VRARSDETQQVRAKGTESLARGSSMAWVSAGEGERALSGVASSRGRSHRDKAFGWDPALQFVGGGDAHPVGAAGFDAHFGAFV